MLRYNRSARQLLSLNAANENAMKDRTKVKNCSLTQVYALFRVKAPDEKGICSLTIKVKCYNYFYVRDEWAANFLNVKNVVSLT